MIINSLDSIDFDQAYLSDDGETLYIFIFHQLNKAFYYDMFKVLSYESALHNNIKTLDENIESSLNLKVFNILNQLRIDNLGKTQGIKLIFLE